MSAFLKKKEASASPEYKRARSSHEIHEFGASLHGAITFRIFQPDNDGKKHSTNSKTILDLQMVFVIMYQIAKK